MRKTVFKGELQTFINKAFKGSSSDIDFIIQKLCPECSFATTRYVDFALSLVENPDGIKRIEYYLFNGNQIQRNYASLYLNRKGIWKPVKEAYERKLIDEIQAFAR